MPSHTNTQTLHFILSIVAIEMVMISATATEFITFTVLYACIAIQRTIAKVNTHTVTRRVGCLCLRIHIQILFQGRRPLQEHDNHTNKPCIAFEHRCSSVSIVHYVISVYFAIYVYASRHTFEYAVGMRPTEDVKCFYHPLNIKLYKDCVLYLYCIDSKMLWTIKYRHCDSSPDIMALHGATAAPALTFSGIHKN